MNRITFLLTILASIFVPKIFTEKLKDDRLTVKMIEDARKWCNDNQVIGEIRYFTPMPIEPIPLPKSLAKLDKRERDLILMMSGDQGLNMK